MTPTLDDGKSRINAVDVLNLIAILALTALVTRFRPALGEQALWLLGILASLWVFVMLSAWLSNRHAFWRAVHDFSPIVTILVLFNAMGPIIETARPVRWDATFAVLDVRIFGALPELWRAILARPAWFTDFAYVAYCGYYVAPVALGIILYVRHPPSQFSTFVFTVLLTFYLTYVGYFIFPTTGPRPPLRAEDDVIGGGALSYAVRQFINFAERNRTDAFPSGHTAGALICLYFAGSMSRRVFSIFAAIAAGIVFSTVYLHYHYVIDVVAGVALAGACGWLGPRLEPLLEPRTAAKRFLLRLGH